MLHTQCFLPWLLLLTRPICTHAWSRPMWYQVGLDLQPWGCQPRSREGCESSLGCPGYWTGLGTNRIYPVAGVTVTTTMMLMLSRALMQRRRSQASKSEHPQLASHPCATWKRQRPISDRALLLGVLHMLDALLLHIECYLQRLATQQRSQIKGTPAQTGEVGVWIDAGSRYETEKNNGAGYFVEHLAFKGTKNRPGNALEKEVESMGAHLNAYTTREHTAYYIKALSKDLPKAVELLADIVQNCSLEDSQIEKERDVILQELQENDTSMRDVVFNYLHATAFQGTPLAQSVEGPSENVRKLSRADLTEYLNRHYKAPRMVLAAAGGLEHQQLLDLAQKHFSGLSGTYDEDAVPTLTPCRFTGSEIRHREDGLPLAHVAIAVEGPGWANPDNVALQVANAIIGHYDCTYGGGMHLSSPLASVAATNKLCQSFQTFNICYADTGLLGAHFVCDHMSIDDMMFVLQGQWMRLCTSATESEVVRGKNLLRNALVSHLDGTTPVCEDIGRSLLTYGRRIPLAEWESRIAEVDARVVREVCSKYFYDQCPAVAGFGPIEQLPDYNRIRSGMFWLRF